MADGQGERQKHRQDDQQRCSEGPVTAVEAADGPEEDTTGGVVVLPGHDEVAGRADERGDADADDQDAVAGGARAARAQDDEDGGADGAERAQPPVADHAGGRARGGGDDDRGGTVVDADQVGGGEAVPGQGLGETSGDAEAGADHHADEDPGQPEVLNDHHGSPVARAEQPGDRVGEAHSGRTGQRGKDGEYGDHRQEEYGGEGAPRGEEPRPPLGGVAARPCLSTPVFRHAAVPGRRCLSVGPGPAPPPRRLPPPPYGRWGRRPDPEDAGRPRPGGRVRRLPPSWAKWRRLPSPW